MDRDIFLFEKMNEIYDNKISFMIESLDNQLRINMLEAQYKVVIESGTKEDFEYLYMEAQEEVKQKKKGVFNGIIEWIGKIKDKLVDFFREKKIENRINKLPDKIEVDSGYQKQFNGFKKFHEWLVKPINLFKQKKYGQLAGDLLKKGAQIYGIAFVVTITNNLIYTSRHDIKKCIDWILKYFKTDCDSVIKMLKSNDNDNDNIPIKILKQIIKWISDIVNAALKWANNIVVLPFKNVDTSKIDKVVDKLDDKVKKTYDKVGNKIYKSDIVQYSSMYRNDKFDSNFVKDGLRSANKSLSEELKKEREQRKKLEELENERKKYMYY